MDVGTTLRHARTRTGLSIEDLAATTRITIPLLHAIEQNAFEKVPSGIFARGFIRAYAREVGLDPEEMVHRYLEQTGDTVGVAGQAADGEIDEDIRAMAVDPERPSGRATWGYGLIVAALLVAFISFTRTADEGHEPALGAAAEEFDVPSSEPDAVPAAEPLAVATSGNSLLQFDIVPSGPCWVEAVVDGKIVVYRLMQAGERETLSAREIALRIGDPGTFTYTINGRPGRPLGPPGSPITVRLTSDSYQQFFAS